MSVLSDPQTYISLLVLTGLEIVLGIDNILFVSIIAGRLPRQDRQKARRIGLALALFGRLVLLFFISYLAHLREPFLIFWNFSFSGRDLVLLSGGLFLLYKSTQEIYAHVEAHDEDTLQTKKAPTFRSAIIQIIVLDIVFSLDSIITAVGLVSHIWIMATAVTVSVAIMMIFSARIGEFIDEYPSLKMLGLSFLLVVSVLLIAESFGHEIPKGYVYFSLIFSFVVEIFNIRHSKIKAKKRAQKS